MNLVNMSYDLVLININTNERFILQHNVAMYKCGRGKANHVLTSSILASREHCMFLRANGGLNVLDLGSSNGVYINGQRQPSRILAPVKINDVIGLGTPNLSPDDNPSSASPAVYKLLVYETESVADLSQATGDTTTKITSHNKRRHSRDSLECKIPVKIIKTEVPDIIDISDDSSDEIFSPKTTDNKSCDQKIVEESNESPMETKTCENQPSSKTKELSRSLQENASEFSFTARTSSRLSNHGQNEVKDNDRNHNYVSSTCLLKNGKKRAEDDTKKLNSSHVARPSTCSISDGSKNSVDNDENFNASNVASTSTHLSRNERKKSVDNDKNPNVSNVASTSTHLPKNERKKSVDNDKNPNAFNVASTSTHLSKNERKKSVDNDKNPNASNVVSTSTHLPMNERKKSVDNDKNPNGSNVVSTSSHLPTSERRKSVDQDKNSSASNVASTSAYFPTTKRKESEDSDGKSNSSKVAEASVFLAPNARKTSEDSDKPSNYSKRVEMSANKRKKSAHSGSSNPSKTTELPVILPINGRKKSTDDENSSDSSKAVETSAILSTDGRKKSADSEKNSKSLKAAQSSATSSTNRRKRSEDSDKNHNPRNDTKSNNSSHEKNKSVEHDGHHCQKPPKVRKVGELEIPASVEETTVKYEPELNIFDDDESIYNHLDHLPNENVVPTPIKLKRVKHEPKTRYSEFDVVMLSDDEDGVFPASQLFGDESDDEIERKVQTKEKKNEDIETDIFENSRDDVSDIIVLSDSDDEDNPWYDRLLRSQLLNESRLSLSNLVKEEPEEEDMVFGIPFGDDLEELFADEMKENERVEAKNNLQVADHAEEAAVAEGEAEEDEGLVRAQDLLKENRFLEEEIFDLCYSSESNKTKKISPDKSKRNDKIDVETIEKMEENEKTVVNKRLSEKTDVESGRMEDKPLPVDKKRTSRKKRLSDHKISLDKQRLRAEKYVAEEKYQSDKISSAEKRSSDEKIGATDERFPENQKFNEEDRTLVEKQPSILKQKSADKTSELEKRSSVEESSLPKRKSVEKSVEKSAEIVKVTSTQKSSLPKQKSAEKTAEIERVTTNDAKSKPKSNKHEVVKRCDTSETKSSNISDNSNDWSDFSEPKSTIAETLPEHPLVISTKTEIVTKTVQLVDAPFLTNGRHRGVSQKITTNDRSSDKQEPHVPSTSRTNDKEKTPTRKLTTKEKKEEAQKIRLDHKMQLKEQRHRLQKNKWAAKCLPPKKKPALSPFTPKERKDINKDRKEKLKQIASEKKAADEIQPSTTRRVVKAKAKVTTNSRNDFLVKELEEQAMLNSANVDQFASENGEKSSDSSKAKDKSLELRTETFTSVDEEKSSRRKEDYKDNKERQINGNNLVEEKASGKCPKVVEETLVKGEIDKIPRDSIKTIPKKTKFLEESEVPNNFLEKSAKPNALKKPSMCNGVAHVFGEQSRRVGQTLTNSTNTNVVESSFLVPDPRIRIGKSGKSVLKENREPNQIKEAGKEKTKKRVSFNDLNTRVDFFEIDPGNSLKKCVAKDAPLIVKHLPKCSSANSKACCPKLEQFLLRIFKWNPVWLEEQKQLNAAPPVVDEKKLSPMLSKYASYDDYYKTTEPLLALELWNGISRDYESKVNQKACFKYSIVNHSIVLTTVPSTTVRVTTLMLEVVVSKKEAERQAHPVYGDLVFFEYISNRKSKEGCQRWKVFAYVTNVRQTTITPLTYFNRDLLTFEKDSHTLLTYTVVTKPLDASDIQTNKVSRLRTISYLRSNIRMIQALQNLPVSPLCNTILQPKVEDYQLPVVANLDSYPLVTKDKLNARQLEAVARVTEAAVQRLPRVCLIQGPPGTGKSKVIVNLVTQILYGNGRYQSNKKLRILVCAPSNAAIDEIVLRLLEIRGTFQKGNRFNMVRIGRIESMHPQVKEVSVSELAGRDVKKTADAYMSPMFTNDSVEEEKRFLQARMNALQLEKSNTMSCQNPLYQRQILRKFGDIQAKYNLLMNRKPANRLDDREKLRLQRAAENTLLKGADVITCTLTSCYTNQMESIFGGKDSISVCIVDEATQSSEAETLIPLMLGVRTLVLVGDTNQLPATVLSQKAKQFGLEQSLFARIQNAFDGQKMDPIILLDTQYRMSIPVASWPNRFFYAGAIKNDPVKYLFPFHCYKIMDLDSTQNEDKFSNTEEASFVAKVIYTLMTRSKLDHLNTPVKIGVITPYNNQKQLVIQKIRERMANVSEKVKKKIIHEVNTVDSFQGQERDVIIMSCVRSNGIGFLSDRQRLCVALTRAKHSLFLCGNFRTFKRDPMWNALLTDARDRGAYVTIKAKAETDEIKPHIVR